MTGLTCDLSCPSFRLDGREFRCTLPPHGGVRHQHDSARVEVVWRALEGGGAEVLKAVTR